MLEKEVRSINHSDLTSQDAPAPETPASAEQTTVLPAATASFAPVVRPAGGQVATKDELFRDVWGDPITGDGTLSVHVRRLRTQIEPDPDNPRYIRTVWGRGYMFSDIE